METTKNGLTHITENILGFVTAKTITRGKTKEGRARIIFDTMSGIERNGNFPVVRHIICLGDAAEKLESIHKGSYVDINGFVVKVAMKDSNGCLLLDQNRQMIYEEHVISDKAILIPRQNRQMSFLGDALAPVDRTSPE